MSSNVFPLASLGGRVLSREPFTDVRVNGNNSGKKTRSTWWASQCYRIKVSLSALRQGAGSRQDWETFNRFFTQHFGQLDSFLLLDPEDNAVSGGGFGTGDGATTKFPLQRLLLGPTYDVTGGPWLASSAPRTNLVLQSEAFDNASWAKVAATVSANAGTAPDGTTTADKLIDTAATSTHLTSQTIAVTSGVSYALSVWAKAAGRTQLVLGGQGGTFTALFDLSAGTAAVTAGAATASITAHPTLSGWYRCAIVYVAPATTSADVQIYLASAGATSYLGNGTSGALLWGAVFEAATGVGPYLTPATDKTSLVTVGATSTATPIYQTATTQPYAFGFELCTDLAPGPQISVAGVLKTLTTDYAIDAYGNVTFVSAPASGAALTWTGSFYKRVMFDSPGVQQERLGAGLYSIPTIDLVTVI